jgi:hypothetical protein
MANNDYLFDIGDLKKPGLLQRKDPENVSVAPTEDPITTHNQDFGRGDLRIEDDGVFYTPPPKATVEGRLSGLLASGSPYIETAKAGAQRQAHSRGLLNTTMAATAGEKAGIESALPIATQDAGYFQNLGLQKQQGEIQKGLYETQGDISSRLSKQQYEQERGLTGIRQEHEMALKDADIEWNKVDLESRMQVEYDRMAQENKDKFNELANAISEDYMNDYIEIMLNPNFKTQEDRLAAINVLNENTRKRYEMAGVVSEVDLTWPGVPEKAEPPPPVTPTEPSQSKSGKPKKARRRDPDMDSR